jgi:hypothetical protein
MNFGLFVPPATSPRPQSRGNAFGPSRALGGTISRQSAGGAPYGAPIDNINSNSAFLKDRLGSIITAKETIER